MDIAMPGVAAYGGVVVWLSSKGIMEIVEP
jgi:hypothetical protein